MLDKKEVEDLYSSKSLEYIVLLVFLLNRSIEEVYFSGDTRIQLIAYALIVNDVDGHKFFFLYYNA